MTSIIKMLVRSESKVHRTSIDNKIDTPTKIFLVKPQCTVQKLFLASGNFTQIV